MLYKIKNQYLTAYIDTFGAQLIRLIDKDNINRLHEASEKTWDKVSPILFPQISRTKGYLYKANNKEYHMPMHGFAKDKEFVIEHIEEDELVLSIKDDEESLLIYPYHFSFKVIYKLLDNKLKVSFVVKSNNDDFMYYMVGGHPGFKVPLYDFEKYEDYFIRFEKKENKEAMQVVDGFLANVYKPYLNNCDVINLKHNLFVPDALIFKNLESNYVDIASINHNKKIRFYFKDFEILAIWAKNTTNTDFVCLEPWNGIQKQFVIDHEKMGVLSLKPHEEKTFSYTIEVID